jgi:hypothetical protein
MKEIAETSDKGKKISTSPDREGDFSRIAAHEKLTLDPQRDIMKGGADQGQSSSLQRYKTEMDNAKKSIQETNAKKENISEKLSNEREKAIVTMKERQAKYDYNKYKEKNKLFYPR